MIDTKRQHPGLRMPVGSTWWKTIGRLALISSVILLILIGADSGAVAQESESESLERVDIEAPERPSPQRARRTPTPNTELPQTPPPRPPDWDTPRDTDRSGYPLGEAIPAVSAVMDKSSLSAGAGALPAQVQIETSQEIARLNVRNYTDLFRKIPGIRAYTYGQGDVGHPIQIRGNQGGHGTDTAVFIDGVPQNFPSASQGGNGISEFSWLTSEMIERIEVIKGPFSVLYGNFAQAGVINIITKNVEPSPKISLEGASFGGFRAVPILGSSAYSPTPFILNEYYTLDGYRDNSQSERWSSFNKVTTSFGAGYLSLRFNYYDSPFGSPSYLGINDVRSGLVSRTSAVSSSDGGNQRRWAAVVNYTPSDQDGSGLHLSAYVDQYVKNRFATMPPRPQRLQDDDRIFYGGRLFYNHLFGNVASVLVGGELRYDHGSARRFSTVNRNITSTTNNYHLRLRNSAWFAQAQVKPVDKVKFVGGLRGDYFRNDIDNRVTAANSGVATPSIVTPKYGVVLTPVENINIFANSGVGFRAPAASQNSPPTGAPNFSLKPYITESWDVGLNATLFGNIYLAFDYYRTTMQNEVRTVSGEQVNIGDSERSGFEVEMKYFPTETMTLFANWAWVDATVTNPTTEGQNLVTGIAEHVVKTGLEFTYALTPDILFLGDIYYEFISGQPQYFGKDPTAVYGPDFDSYNLKFTLQSTNWNLFLTAIIQPREYSSDYIGKLGSQLSFSPKPFLDMTAGVGYTY